MPKAEDSMTLRAYPDVTSRMVRGEISIVRRIIDGLVKLRVHVDPTMRGLLETTSVRPGRGIPIAAKLLHSLHELVMGNSEIDQLLISDPARRKLCGQALKFGSHLVHFRYFTRLEGARTTALRRWAC